MSTTSKIRKVLKSPGAEDVLDGLVHAQASTLASNVNNKGLNAQLEFLESRGVTDEEVLQYLEEAVAG